MIELLITLPVLIKVLGTLLLILILNRLLRDMLSSILLSTFILGLWVGHAPGAIAAIAWRRFSSANNLILMLVVLQVIWLSTLMAESGAMEELVEAIRARIPRRFAIAALPAVIGFLPMPGGAVFSAPLVDSFDREGRMAGGLKAQTNYWFRHIWEYWWPLYPAVLLAADLSGVEIWQFMLLQLPVTLLAAGCGYLFLLSRIPEEKEVALPIDEQRQDLARACPEDRMIPSPWKPVAPILAVIAVYALIRLALPEIARINRYLPMMSGLLLALAVFQLQRRRPLSSWLKAVLSKRGLKLALFVAAVRIYGAVLEAPLSNGTLLIEQIGLDLDLLGIPLLAVMILIPFISGMTMGLIVGVVGACFPIIMSLIGPDPGLSRLISVAMLAYGCGFMGILLSPVHICLIVSSEYFKTRLLSNLTALIGPVALLTLGIVLLSLGVERLGF